MRTLVSTVNKMFLAETEFLAKSAAPLMDSAAETHPGRGLIAVWLTFTCAGLRKVTRERSADNEEVWLWKSHIQ